MGYFLHFAERECASHIVVCKDLGQANIPWAIFWVTSSEICPESIHGWPILVLASMFVVENGILGCGLNLVAADSSHQFVCVFTNLSLLHINTTYSLFEIGLT